MPKESTNNSKFISGGFSDSNFVSQGSAEEIAKRIDENYMATKKYEGNIRTMGSKFILSDKLGKPAVYVFNYANNDGYAVIAADYRYEPILAFINTGHIELGDTLPSMLAEWYGYTVESIQNIRTNTNQDTSDYKGSRNRWGNEIDGMNVRQHFWELMECNIFEAPDPCVNPFPSESKKLALISNWGQGDGYNDLINSNLNCSSNGNSNNKPDAGCVAIAVAQIMKYWSASTNSAFNYNYSLMPNNTGTNETQKLVRDIGNALNMNYGCDGSGANSGVVNNELQNYFGYSSGGSYQNYSGNARWDIRNEILNNRPVYFSGDRTSIQNWFWTNNYNGHAWVGLGYQLSGVCWYKHFWYFMNWGWDGQGNGWYYQDDWQPHPDRFYQYDRKFIKNIHP